jgi:uncharacterized membrane protein YhaH (DUF805 family)
LRRGAGREDRAVKWMILPYQRYFDFSGRSRRMEYWMFTLFYMVVCLVLGAVLVAGVVNSDIEGNRAPGPVFWVGFVALMSFVLGSIIPSIAVTVRRFHDQDLSGWLYLLCFIPYVGGIIIFVFMCLDGARDGNRFGLDPKGRGLAGVFA